MPITRANAVRPPHAVFTKINMHGGDKTVCWEWLGCLSPNPIFCWRGKRHQASRMVYSLKNGIPYDDVPVLTWTCNNRKCCNPHHLVPYKGYLAKINKRVVDSFACT